MPPGRSPQNPLGPEFHSVMGEVGEDCSARPITSRHWTLGGSLCSFTVLGLRVPAWVCITPGQGLGFSSFSRAWGVDLGNSSQSKDQIPEP